MTAVNFQVCAPLPLYYPQFLPPQPNSFAPNNYSYNYGLPVQNINNSVPQAILPAHSSFPPTNLSNISVPTTNLAPSVSPIQNNLQPIPPFSPPYMYPNSYFQMNQSAAHITSNNFSFAQQRMSENYSLSHSQNPNDLTPILVNTSQQINSIAYPLNIESSAPKKRAPKKRAPKIKIPSAN